eukprot:TRINITY_DN9189_c0_g1_i4.p1 TRINITY_DN9189_c0_g1~~TRINITY_DN9189_c0_g1_i4.p1  ORF type:complete len:347 (+),score=82.76 TRINITY_DN9189_c0_g1_i4:152-1192(+)
MIRRPPRSTLSSSSAASDVYKRQVSTQSTGDTPDPMVQLICSVAEAIPTTGFSSWLTIWLAYAGFGYVMLTGSSLAAFIYLYCYPTYNKWKYKSNPKYPTATYVMGEVLLGGILGPLVVAFAPSIHLYLIADGHYKHHCDTPQSWSYKLLSAFLVVLITDFYEWGWHFLGHYIGALWSVHKHHHKYFNPTPFGTIADYPADNFMRSLYFMIVNGVAYGTMGIHLDLDMIYIVTAFLTVGWGMYLHCGHEISWIPYDNRYFNTSFQHYAHHAVSSKNTPYHTGFFVKLWDNMAGSVYTGDKVLPAIEQQKRGIRTRAEWDKVKSTIPNYSVLLSPSFWIKHLHEAPL